MAPPATLEASKALLLPSLESGGGFSAEVISQMTLDELVRLLLILLPSPLQLVMLPHGPVVGINSYHAQGNMTISYSNFLCVIYPPWTCGDGTTYHSNTYSPLR